MRMSDSFLPPVPEAGPANLDSIFDAIFVISLATSLERRWSVERSFGRIHCRSYELVDAVDGNELDLDELETKSRLTYCEYQNRSLLPGEVGCYLSHVKVWELIRDRRMETALVCEDDIEFSTDAARLFTLFMMEVPSDWDIVHFHSHRGHAADAGKRRRVSRHVLEGWNESHGTLCYAINARCAAFLLEHACPIRDPVDGLTNWPTSDWCRGYKGYIVDPFPCRPGAFPSPWKP